VLDVSSLGWLTLRRAAQLRTQVALHPSEYACM